MIVFDIDRGRRTIDVLAIPYGDVADNGNGKWTFSQGVVRWPTQVGRVKVLMGHDRATAVGVVTALDDTRDALYARLRISRGTQGDEALTLAEDGVYDGVSVGLWHTEIGAQSRDGVYVVKRADLAEISLTPFPSFDRARINGIQLHRNRV